MAKKYVFLFPGQGAQSPGMMQDICNKYPEAATLLSSISKEADRDMESLLWKSDAAALSRSDNSQLAMTAGSLLVAKVLASKGITPSIVAGFSLGEFPALFAAGVLSFSNLIKIVCKRGAIMQQVCDDIAAKNAGAAPGMLAVLGLPPQKVIEVAQSIPDVYPSNMNSIKQTVVSGTHEGLQKAAEAFKNAGARRTVPLKVAGPFHCPLMQDAADQFLKVVEDVNFADPAIPLMSNVTGGQVKSGEQIKSNMGNHITHGVQWTSEEDAIVNLIKQDSANEYQILEVGAGQVLAGLWRNIDFAKDHPCTSIGDVPSIDALQP